MRRYIMNAPNKIILFLSELDMKPVNDHKNYSLKVTDEKLMKYLTNTSWDRLYYPKRGHSYVLGDKAYYHHDLNLEIDRN